MANKHDTLTSLFSDIAVKIRKKTGTTGNIVADEFPDILDGILTPADGSIPVRNLSLPEIAVDTTTGSISAKVVQEAGYIGSKQTRNRTMKLSTQDAKTVTPGTSDQIAVAAKKYTIGDITVVGDSNLIPENIASGVSIFGVTGTHESVVSKTTIMPVSITGTRSNSNKTVTFAWPTDHDWRNLCGVSLQTTVTSTNMTCLMQTQGVFLQQCIIASMLGQYINVTANDLVFTTIAGTIQYGGCGAVNNTGNLIDNASPALVVKADESGITITIAGGSITYYTGSITAGAPALTFPSPIYLILYYFE